MKNYLYVFIGGAVGGLMRVMITREDTIFAIGGMDFTILMINITGAFLLGMFLSGTTRFPSQSPGLQLGIAVGFFGSFTTFSTLSMEAVGLLQTGDVAGLLFYVFASLFLGLVAAELGFRVGIGTELIRIGRSREKLPGTHQHQNLVPVPAQEEEED